MAAVELDSVTKRFDPATVAVDDLTLEIDDGELMVLLGPSGCGKSTVLRLIAGLERPDRGLVRIGSRVVNTVDAKDRDVAMVFQSYALYPHMSIRRNIGFPLKPRGVGRHDRDAEAERVAGQLGLVDVLDRKPGQLSGGQRQRVALARALVRRPSVFLMDEPLSNLDAKLRTETRADLAELHHELGATIVYVTHDQVEALTMADRIGVLDRGRLQQLGTPPEIYDTPANLFVAGFVGAPAMNLWPATIVDGDSVEVAGFPIADAAFRAVWSGGTEVVAGVRPEAVQIGADGVAATVDWLEDLGHEHLVGCTTAAGDFAAVRWNDRRRDPPPPGTSVRLRPDCEQLHWFDPGSGERIAWP
ncbi:MAG: ABC transporter ATP-binding protein [Acidimicrobiia bacterium]|nr:ABC transporter ATP-binding protein [Acidimicrobiia bacterium]